VSLFTETVVLVGRSESPTGRDDYGNDIYGEVRVTSPAWLEQRNGSESTDARESSTANSWLFLPRGVSLAAVDRVEWDGRTWQLDGEPGVQPGGFVAAGYQLVSIKRATG
jgi:hypothetical protein